MIVKFSDREIKLIQRSLPNAIPARKLRLLPLILQAWGCSVLPEHLFDEPIAVARKRSKQLQSVAGLATELSSALQAVKSNGDQFLIIREMLSASGTPIQTGARKGLENRIAQECAFLDELASAANLSLASSKMGRGRPNNIPASLVIMDLAAIFTWLTGRTATRQVSRDNGDPAGPFWNFAAAIWPVIFGKGDDGLQAAIKKLAAARAKKLSTKSPVLHNMAISHPEWRIFDK